MEFEEEEALFRSYPYSVYYVESVIPTRSHANTYGMTYHSPPQPENYKHTTILAPSHYSSHRSNISITNVNEKEGGNAVLKSENGEIEEEEIDDVYYEGGLWKYVSFSYSNSGWWIWLQLGWRLLFSFIVALLVFYVLVVPPAPVVSIKVVRIQQFRLGQGVDAFGVPTKVLNCNATVEIIIDNKSKLFDLHIHPPMLAILFGHVPFATSQGGELYARSDDTTRFELKIGTINKPMYGAGPSMEDLLKYGNGLSLIIKVDFKSSFHVVLGLIEPKFHHKAQCLLHLGRTYDKRNRIQVFTSTCVVTSEGTIRNVTYMYHLL